MFNSTSLTKLEQEQIKALKRLDLKKVQKFIEKGMDVNKVFAEEGKQRPIHLVIPFRGPTAILEYLLARDDIEVDALDAFGNTALMYASMHGNLSACRLLIQHGADYHLKGRLIKKNAIEFFKDRNDHLFSDFERIIKDHEEAIRAEANDNTKIVSETPFAHARSSLTQRKTIQIKTHNEPLVSTKNALDSARNDKGYNLSFWKLFSFFNRRSDSSEVRYIPLKNTTIQNSPKQN